MLLVGVVLGVPVLLQHAVQGGVAEAADTVAAVIVLVVGENSSKMRKNVYSKIENHMSKIVKNKCRIGKHIFKLVGGSECVYQTSGRAFIAKTKCTQKKCLPAHGPVAHLQLAQLHHHYSYMHLLGHHNTLRV